MTKSDTNPAMSSNASSAELNGAGEWPPVTRKKPAILQAFSGSQHSSPELFECPYYLELRKPFLNVDLGDAIERDQQEKQDQLINLIAQNGGDDQLLKKLPEPTLEMNINEQALDIQGTGFSWKIIVTDNRLMFVPFQVVSPTVEVLGTIDILMQTEEEKARRKRIDAHKTQFQEASRLEAGTRKCLEFCSQNFDVGMYDALTTRAGGEVAFGL